MVLVSYKPYSMYRTLQTNRTSFLGLQSSDDSSTLGGVTSLRGEERRMMTVEFITALFYTYCISRRNFSGGRHLRVR